MRYLSKVVNVYYPTCIWRPRWGWGRTHWNITKIFVLTKLESLATMRRCLRHLFSRIDRTPACDGRPSVRHKPVLYLDRHTQGHSIVLASVAR